jgi:hypothetical protein
MISNLQKALRGCDHSLTVKNENRNGRRRHVMIISSELMLYGSVPKMEYITLYLSSNDCSSRAQIHLHRLRWVPRFNLKLRACSFNVLSNVDRSDASLDEVSRPSEPQSFFNELENETEYELARQSLATIHSVS